MKEYFARFKYLYITLVVILVVTIAATAVYMTKQKAAAANKGKRMNTECLTDERVFDYADAVSYTHLCFRYYCISGERQTGCGQARSDRR